jgi:hypothetical protein
MTGLAFIVRNLTEAGAALAAAAAADRPVVLLSADSAAGYAGAGYFKALIAAAAQPGVASAAFLDCGDSPGLVLAALREGVGGVIFTGAPAMNARLDAIARAQGAQLLSMRPPAVDVAALRRQGPDWREALRRAFDDAGNAR